ncbi:SOS response-associated peptidase [Flavihumibacter fluvii]|uniref:SOS response-associated peptidase n=1 Tax=Flavihumibacter fluvii TaxID=2838157 RepID=UPI001BDF5D52|nr:SOS response-associated peptidase [Flavihumibacter fluvii]ULQ53717.1 SOS response-associated peptidase [Flavihumibacter fluvii]
MCYYNRLIVPVQQAFNIGDFTIEWPAELRQAHPIQSGFEFGDWPIIIWSEEKQVPQLVNAHWEFLAPWIKSFREVEAGRQNYTTLNAIGEKMLESRLYKDAVIKRRCLVLSSGFYEWRHWKPPGAKKDMAIPYFIYLPGEPMFMMGGIWQPWTDEETGEHVISFAIVTTEANKLMAQVHNKKKRMPLILDQARAAKWIQPSLTKSEIQSLTHFHFDAAKMRAYTIAKDFRTATDPIQSVEYDFLPAIN